MEVGSQCVGAARAGRPSQPDRGPGCCARGVLVVQEESYPDACSLACTQEKYPELESDDARKKIANTGLKLHELAVESGSRSARVDVVLCTRVLSYSSIRFDGDTVVVSVFDQFRAGQVDSPT